MSESCPHLRRHVQLGGRPAAAQQQRVLTLRFHDEQDRNIDHVVVLHEHSADVVCVNVMFLFQAEERCEI